MNLRITVYPVDEQVRGEFDQGKILETKPIAFPGESDKSQAKSIGPLFYWSWAYSKTPSVIAFHPHRSFEIMSYVLEGEIGHLDSMGNDSKVTKGGAQVMNAGSGISHEEHFERGGTEILQIWFEPYLEDAKKRPPQYQEHPANVFPVEQSPGIIKKTVIGKGSPISLVADVLMLEISLKTETEYTHSLEIKKAAAVLVLKGKIRLESEDFSEQASKKDFVVIRADLESRFTIKSEGDSAFSLVEISYEVDYPLYPRSTP